jgi:hypothetical protein
MSKKSYTSKSNGRTHRGRYVKAAKQLDADHAHHSRFDYYNGRGGPRPGSLKKRQ